MSGAASPFKPRVGGPIDKAMQHLADRGWVSDIDLADAIDVPLDSLLGSMTQAIKHNLVETELRKDVRHYALRMPTVAAASWLSALTDLGGTQDEARPVEQPVKLKSVPTSLPADGDVEPPRAEPERIHQPRFICDHEGRFVVQRGDAVVVLDPHEAKTMLKFAQKVLP